jgi:UV DNA damage endonuclease
MEQMDQDELEHVFVLERETGEPNPDGSFPGPAAMDGMPVDLKEQLKATIKLLQKTDGSLVSDKRKRDDMLHSTMATTLRCIASQYPTTIAEDERLLAQSNLGRRQRMAIRVRLGEKRLLQEAYDYFSGKAGQEAPEASNKRAKRSE